MKIEIELSDLAIRVLGPDHRATVEKLLEAEALRRWHIERSKPKKHNSLARRLRSIYDRQRELLGDEAFERLLGDQFRRLEAAISVGDAAIMNEFISQQPWVRSVREPLTKTLSGDSNPPESGGKQFAKECSSTQDRIRPSG